MFVTGLRGAGKTIHLGAFENGRPHQQRDYRQCHAITRA